jgi:beta-glucosidase
LLPTDIYSQKAKPLPRELATESMVLLKNKAKVLPLGSSVKSIALVGPLAKDQADLIGNWAAHGDPKDAETIIDGFN